MLHMVGSMDITVLHTGVDMTAHFVHARVVDTAVFSAAHIGAHVAADTGAHVATVTIH